MTPLPSQWLVWDHTNLQPSEEMTGEGQFLYALKDTKPGDRQLVFEGGSDRGIIAVVDFAGHNRKSGPIYYAWGRTTLLDRPILATTVRSDPVLSGAFAARRGRAKRLDRQAAERVEEVSGGLPPQAMPTREPDTDAELDLWVGPAGRPPEFLVHDEVESTRRLWREIGFRQPPRRGHKLRNGTYPDLYSHEGVVGEVKNIVGPNWGPRQLRSYMRQLDLEEPQRAPWRGVLIHGGDKLSPAVRELLEQDPQNISVWNVQRRRVLPGSRARRQLP